MSSCAMNNNYQEPRSPNADAEVNLNSHPDLNEAQTATECASLGPNNPSLNNCNSNTMLKSVVVKHSSTLLTALSGKTSSHMWISAHLYHDEDSTNPNDQVDIGVCTEQSEEAEISVIPEPLSVLPTSNSVWDVPETNIPAAATTETSKIELVKVQSTDNEVTSSNKNAENDQNIPVVKLDSIVNENSATPGLLSALIIDAADGLVAPATIKIIWGVIDHIVNEIQEVPSSDEQKESSRRMFSKPILPSVFHDLEDSQLAKILNLVPLQEKRRMRLVCSRWKSILDTCFLKFQRLLTRNSIQFLKHWSGTPMQKLIVCDLLDVSPHVLHKLAIFSTVKELQIESPRPEDYDTRQKYNNPTIGEINLIEILQCCQNIESLILNETALGNFGLEVLSKATVECETDTLRSDVATIDKNGNKIKGEKNSEILVGWKWANTHNVTKGVSAVSAYFQKIMNDLDDNMYTCDGKIWMEPHSNVIPSDPPVLEISYQQEIQPCFSAFTRLNTVDLHRLKKLTIKVQPTQTTEKLGLIAFLHVLTFPQLRSFSLFVHEYFPDEALYQTIVKFIAKHHATLRHLTFINPVLSSRITAKPTLCHLLGLEKVKLKSFTVSWEKLIGLEQFWADGLYLLGLQKRLHTLNVHTSKALRVEAAIWNNFRFLTQAYIHISDTAGYSNKTANFDCNCFKHCSKLKILSLRVGLAVEIKNACKIPDTIERLHWYARYNQNDIRWFSRFLVLAKSIYFYHEKDVPIEVLTPLNLTDFINFIQLPSLEQLKLPKITQQDPRVTRFCERCGQGLVQHKDLFFIDRNLFCSVQEECLKIADLSW